MGTIARGNKIWLQLGKQTVPGTPVAATGVRLELITFDLSPVQGFMEDPSMVDGVLGPRDIQQGGRTYVGTMKMRLNYIGLLKIWEMLLGDQTSAPATPATSSVVNGLVTYTFKQGIDLPLHTAEFFEGGMDGLATCTQYTDFVCFSGKISSEAVASGEAGIYTLECGTAGRVRAISVSPASLSLAAAEMAVFKHAGTLVDGLADSASDFEPKGISISLDMGIDRERFQQGTLSANPFIRSSKQTCEWELKLGLQKFTQQTALEAWTNAAPHLLLTGEVGVGTGSAFKRTIDFASAKARVVGVSKPYSQFGTIYQNVKYRCAVDSSAQSALTIINVNESTSIALG